MRVFKFFANALETQGRYRTLKVLRGMSPRQLEDFGISVELLEQGVSAWPWRAPEEKIDFLTLKLSSACIGEVVECADDDTPHNLEKTAA